MLKNVVVFNFINFVEHVSVQRTIQRNNSETSTSSDQQLKERPLLIFIGASNTGKTSMVECILRCCSDDINTYDTRVCDKTKLAYAACLFHHDEKYVWESLKEQEVKTTLNATDNKIPVVAFYVRNYRVDKIDVIFKWMLIPDKDYLIIGKMVMDTPSRNEVKYFCYRPKIKIFPEDFQINEIFESCTLMERYIENQCSEVLQTNETDIHCNSKSIYKNVYMDLLSSKRSHRKGTLPDCFELGPILFIFAHRGINQHESSLNEQLMSHQDKFRECLERTRCLQLLYKRLLQDEDLLNEFKSIFYGILGDKEIEFIVGDDGYLSFKLKGKRREPLSLLMIPEGVYHAALLAMVLATKEIKTILIDEVTRGMHHTMSEALFYQIQKYKNKKTIIAITHSSAFIPESSKESLYAFSAVKKDGQLRQTCCSPFENQTDKFKGLLFSDYKHILFCKKVLIVEGKSDSLFVNALLQTMKNEGNQSHTSDANSDANTSACKLRCKYYDSQKTICKRNSKATLQGKSHLLNALHVFQAAGKENIPRLVELCNKCSIPCAVLMDNDNIQKHNFDYQSSTTHFPQSIHEALKSPLDVPIQDKPMEYRKILRKHNHFMWKCGNLEDMVNKSKEAFSVLEDLPTQNIFNKKLWRNLTENQLIQLVTILKEKNSDTKDFIDFLLEFLGITKKANTDVSDSI